MAYAATGITKHVRAGMYPCAPQTAAGFCLAGLFYGNGSEVADPGTVIQPILGEWQPHVPERPDQEELADWQAGRNAIYQLAALTVGARLAVADA